MNNEKKHIIYFTPGFAENESDTRCIPALQFFFKELKQQFEGNISIISFQYPYIAKNYKWFGIDVYAIGGNNNRLKKQLVWHKAKKIFKQLHAKQPVTDLHSFWMGECSVIASSLAIKYNLNHSCTLMGQDVLMGNNYFKKIVKNDKLITLSNFHQEQLLTNYKLNSIVIPWGINVNEQLDEKKNIDIIGVGSLTELKSYHEFIEVVRLLKNSFPNINCRIVGDGPLKIQLKKKLEIYGLTNNIEIMGLLSYKETQKLISKSKALLHLSSFESFGMVIIEALNVQTFVISKPSGIANQIDQVLKVNSIYDAVKELTEILNNKRFKGVLNNNFLIQETVKKYLKLYS